MRTMLLALTLSACLPSDDPAALTELPYAEQLAPPVPGFNTSWSGMATRGGNLTLDAELPPVAPVGTRVFFVVTNAGIGRGMCPPQLLGDCLSISGTPMLAGSARSDAAGQASLDWEVPLAWSDIVGLQAVVLHGGTAYLSTATSIDIVAGILQNGEVCSNAGDACDVGLACCYPCGIPGCQHTCTTPCDPAQPWCLDECPLLP